MASSLNSDNTNANATKKTTNSNAVFIDTNLDTHLAVPVYEHDTVSDLKKRIESEHPSCFPKFGHIHIHGIKVHRTGYIYDLSDSMSVTNAFNGFNDGWFLTVEASSLGEEATQSDQLITHASPKS